MSDDLDCGARREKWPEIKDHEGAPIHEFSKVWLRSGGPEMRPVLVHDGKLLCHWYDRDGNDQQHYFAPGCLTQETPQVPPQEDTELKTVNSYRGHRARWKTVLVKLGAKQDKSKGGIHIPDGAVDTLTGTVVSVGSEVPDLKPGDCVRVKKYIGEDFEIDGEKMLHISHEAVALVMDAEV